MLAKFPCLSLAAKSYAANLLKYGVVIYLLWSSILFSTTVRVVVAVKLLMLGLSSLSSFVLALRAAFVANLVIIDILFSRSFILALREVLVAK